MDMYIFVVSVWYHERMDIQKTALRLPKDLHKMVSDAARQVGHSMNAEIISRLRASFGNNIQTDSQSLTAEDMRRVAQDVVWKELVLDKEDYDYPQALKLIQYGASIPMLRSLLGINKQTIVAIRNEHNILAPPSSLDTKISKKEVEHIYQEWEILGKPSNADGFLELYKATGQPLSLLWNLVQDWRHPIQWELRTIDKMERQNRWNLIKQLRALLVCLFKYKYQPNHSIKASQQTTIDNQREALNLLFKDNPRLTDEIQRSFGKAYPMAVRQVVEEFGLPENLLPTECPWMFEQAMSRDFWPEPTALPL